MAAMNERPSIFDMSLEALAADLERIEQPRYRADQVFDWIYRKGAASVAEMSNIPLQLREILEQKYYFSLPAVSDRLFADDGTIKYRIVFSNGDAAECVMMPEQDNDGDEKAVSLCISSQVGCTLGCSFCATGTMGLVRNLSAGEIVSQVVLMLRELPREPRTVNILFMGMGEPLLNMDATLEALGIFNDSRGLAIPMRRIVVSTAGISKGIRRLFELPKPPRLALSLHAPSQELRLKLMPISRRYPLDELLELCRSLPFAAREKITMEYILLSKVNDQPEHARDLARLLKGMRAKVNLIPHNRWEGIDYEEPSERVIEEFMGILSKAGVTATVRRSRGRSASAACGQLAIRKMGVA